MNTLEEVQQALNLWSNVRLATLDPGLSPALVVWQSAAVGQWTLVEARRATAPAKGNHLVRALSAGDDLSTGVSVNYLVSEWPESRGAGRSVNRADQLFPMVACAAAVALRLGFSERHTFTLTPTEWVGAVPKSTKGDPRESPRGARVWNALTPGERELLESAGLVQHDVLDAVGIGLVATGRCRRGVAAPRRRR